MRYLLIPILGSFLFGCRVPEKPEVQLCHFDYDRSQFICAMTDLPGEIYYLPAQEMDKATSFTPSDWEAIKNYTQTLREYIKLSCRQ